MSATDAARRCSSTPARWAAKSAAPRSSWPSEEIERIASCYHRWRGTEQGDYVDEPGFCKNATLAEIEAAGFALSPGRYVGAPESEEDEIAFAEKMATLVDRLADEMPRTSDWRQRYGAR